jgi:steroid 5-alpha reductase family enzyme
MQKRGDLVQDQEGRWVEGPALDWETLPARVGAVVVERIGRLAQPLWAALRVASVEGEVFTAEMVARVQATDEREMLGCLSGELDRKHRGLGSLLLLIWGALSLGRSFRMALPESRQPLVTGGLYRWMRNPLALSIDLLTLGILLLAPSWLALLTFALTVVSYEWKIRIEENYLREAHGEAHAEYCARTGRHLPRLSVLVASR